MRPENTQAREVASPPAGRKMAATVLARFNRARLGSPERIFVGAGGIGDDLLCTTVMHEFKKRHTARIGMLSRYGSLFEGNPDVDFVIPPRPSHVRRIMHYGLPLVPLAYTEYDPVQDRDTPLTEHILVKICRAAGITGEIGLKPRIFLKPGELAAGRYFEKQIAIQSSSLGSPHPMANKAWFLERFQLVGDELSSNASLIQLGVPSDPPICGALDLRGKTTLRESAAILANSLIFTGTVGFLMHLARAVDCRSVIVYGGRETPGMTGYPANANLTGSPPCSPCWLRNTCANGHECMRMISAGAVLDAALGQIEKYGSPLGTDVATISPDA